MAGSSFFNYVRKVIGTLAIIITVLALSGCGEGDGKTGIQNTAATPLPDLPPGFCDPINFEIFCDQPAIINFNGGATIIVDNPDRSGINDSERVARMQKFPDQVFGGTRLNVPNAPIDFSLGEKYKVKVWSPRSVVVTFKLEEEGNPGGGLAKDLTHTGGSEWQELCFDFTGQNVPPPVIGLTIIFDNGTQGAADILPGEWTFYYDDITQVQSCADTGPATGIVPDVTLYYPNPAGDPPDLAIGVDYTEITAFGSGSVINPSYADDNSFGEVLAVTSGTGYNANIGQIGFIGFAAGFVTFYETLDFKVKGLPNFVLYVTLYDGGERLRINLSSSDFAEALDNGWYQVSIPLSNFTGLTTATGIVFESDDTSPMQFTFFLNDIGFGEEAGDGGNGGGDTGGGGAFDDGLLTNGDFEDGVGGSWIGNALNVIDDGGNFVNSANVETAGNPFDVNLSQVVTITPDETYTLTFKARSDGGRTMLAGIGLNEDPWTAVTETVNLTAEWQTFELELTATGFGNANSRVLFDLGADTGLVLIDDVSLVVTGGDTGGGGPFDDGLLTNGDFEDGVGGSWIGNALNVIDDGGNFVNSANVETVGNPFDVNLSQVVAITPDETYTLTFKARSDGTRTMLAGIGLNEDPWTAVVETVNLTAEWQTFELQLTATGFGNANSRVLFDMGAATGLVLIDDVSLVVTGGDTGGGGGPVEGNLAVNGGFDSGDFTGWAQYPSAQTTQTIVVDPTTSSNVARLFIPASAGGVNNVLKQERLLDGEGVFSAGDVIQISFDYRGEPGEGILFVKSICETAEPICGDKLHNNGNPFGPTGTWTSYSDTFTLGAGVTGYTLEFAAVCGGTGTCVAEYFIDNVSITIQ